MHMNDYHDKNAVRYHILRYLPARKRINRNVKGFNNVINKNPIYENMVVTDRMVQIPKIFYDLCHFIKEHVEQEGIFKLEGNKTKQDKLRKKILKHQRWQSEDVDVIDVAALLKYFIRHLPGSLIPPVYAEVFLRCYNLDDRETLFLATLLLPTENLNLLSYLMNFFSDVAKFSNYNKMASINLAVCIASSIMPLCEFTEEIENKTIDMVNIFIQHSDAVGIIPPTVQEQIEVEKKNIGIIKLCFTNIGRILTSFFC